LAGADRGPRGLLFDLFGTLVFFDAARLPRVVVGGVERPGTIADADELLGRLEPAPTVERLIESIRAVSEAFVREAGPAYTEMSSPERFRRALAALEVGGDVTAVAAELSRRHMRTLADAVVCPPDRVDLLERLSAHYAIALVSNFDHGPTAHELLRRHGLYDFFGAVVVSEEVGIRKPHARTFLIACERLGLEPGECLHIGDSHEADIRGATSAGIGALWINAGDGEIAPALGRLADVCDLPLWLESR
jgi:HAD superfamily hydrolase (TIGR01549 family)